MPNVQTPTYFDTGNSLANRRQDSEDRFFADLVGEPRAFNGNGVLLTLSVLVAGPVLLTHALGYPARGWLLRRVECAPGVVTGPRLPFYRSDLQSTKNVLELYIQDPAIYDFLVF